MSEPAKIDLSAIVAPDAAPDYRGWRCWFDFGHYQHGIVYRETKWRAAGPDGQLLESPSPQPGERLVDGFSWIRQEIDRRVAA